MNQGTTAQCIISLSTLVSIISISKLNKSIIQLSAYTQIYFPDLLCADNPVHLGGPIRLTLGHSVFWWYWGVFRFQLGCVPIDAVFSHSGWT